MEYKTFYGPLCWPQGVPVHQLLVQLFKSPAVKETVTERLQYGTGVINRHFKKLFLFQEVLVAWKNLRRKFID